MSIILLVFGGPHAIVAQQCTPRSEIRDKHVVRYRAYNGTFRGCEVTPNFYTQQHKRNRGKLSRSFLIEICEGNPRTSPRIGRSFEICPFKSKAKPKTHE